MKLTRLLATLLVVGTAAACGGPDTAPAGTGGPAGSLALVLDAPDDRTGALLLSISGGPVDSVRAVAGTSVATEVAAGETQAVITGSLPNGGVVARLYVPEADAARYRVVVLQAADAASFERRAPGSYGMALTP